MNNQCYKTNALFGWSLYIASDISLMGQLSWKGTKTLGTTEIKKKKKKGLRTCCRLISFLWEKISSVDMPHMKILHNISVNDWWIGFWKGIWDSRTWTVWLSILDISVVTKLIPSPNYTPLLAKIRIADRGSHNCTLYGCWGDQALPNSIFIQKALQSSFYKCSSCKNKYWVHAQAWAMQ